MKNIYDLLFSVTCFCTDKFTCTPLSPTARTLIPPLLAHFYQTHPMAVTDALRSRISITLLWLWAGRLTHSYFRREGWRIGWREDWRFALYRQQLGLWWYPASFFIAYISQHAMLIGLTLPYHAVHTSSEPFCITDCIAACLCLTGIVIAAIADNQLHAFMQENERRAQRGEPKVLVLNTGLWRYSRHPNHFGEQVFTE